MQIGHGFSPLFGIKFFGLTPAEANEAARYFSRKGFSVGDTALILPKETVQGDFEVREPRHLKVLTVDNGISGVGSKDLLMRRIKQ